MMNCCAQYEDALWEAAESGYVPEALQRHCADCQPCRDAARELQQIQRGFTALKTLEHPAPQPDISSYLPRHGFRPHFAWGFAAVAACLALLWLALPSLFSRNSIARGRRTHLTSSRYSMPFSLMAHPGMLSFVNSLL